MYIHYTFGVIFVVFILCIHCDNVNKVKEMDIPLAPRNLIAKTVTAHEIFLLWEPPSIFTTHIQSIAVSPKNKGLASDSTKSVIINRNHESNFIKPLTNLTFQNKSYDIDDIYYKPYAIEKETWNDGITSSNTLKKDESNIGNRHARLHSMRKRWQNTKETNSEIRAEKDVEIQVHIDKFSNIVANDVVNKSLPDNMITQRDKIRIAYILYYEEGVYYKMTPIIGVPMQYDIKDRSLFRSEIGFQRFQNAPKNLTLLNKSGISSEVVEYHLKNLKPFTPYKIWVRAFYFRDSEVITPSNLLERLGPESTALYIVTDVSPPSAPIIQNLTYDHLNGHLHLQWRQPLDYNNSLDQYVVTLTKIPQLQSKTRITLPASKDDIEITIKVVVEPQNVARYEVKIYAVTRSITQSNVFINGLETPPAVCEWDPTYSEAQSLAPELTEKPPLSSF